jgi:hypothetical protein
MPVKVIMKKFPLLIFVITTSEFISGNAFCQDHPLGDSYKMNADFLNKRNEFNADYLDWEVKLEEWASAVWCWSAEKDFNVLETQHFTDKGRHITRNFVSDDLNIKLIVRHFVVYDKKWDDPDVKIVKTFWEYFVWDDKGFKRYDAQFREVGSPEENIKAKGVFEQNFAEFVGKNKLKV